jgi:hypothetical protein
MCNVNFKSNFAGEIYRSEKRKINNYTSTNHSKEKENAIKVILIIITVITRPFMSIYIVDYIVQYLLFIWVLKLSPSSVFTSATIDHIIYRTDEM